MTLAQYSRPSAEAGHEAAASPAVAATSPWINLAARLVAEKHECRKPCFVGPQGELSYAELDREMRRAASALTLLGARAGDRIFIALDDGFELATIFYAGLAIGAIPVVFNPKLDARSSVEVLNDCAPVLAFCKPAYLDTLEAACWSTGGRTRALVAAPGERGHIDWRPAEADPNWRDFVYRDVEQTALIQYTSGTTTGRPKGVAHSSRGALAACEQLAARRLGLTSEDVIYSVSKTFFGYGMGNSLFFPLYVGATAVLDPRWPTRETVMENLTRHCVTALFAVPTVFRMLLAADRPHCALRLALSAGAPLSARIRSAWRAHFGLPVHDSIGATELFHIFATTYPDSAAMDGLGGMVGDWRSVIVDADERVVAPGEIGVLLVQSSARALGYWSRSAETVQRFDDPRFGIGWFRTGDLFSQDASGRLHFHGREDDRFKVYGRWIIPGDIEAFVARHLPDLDEVVLAPGRGGDGELRPVLFLRAEGSSLDAAAERVASLLRANYDSYQCPALYLSFGGAPPLSSNGKLDRRALSERANAAFANEAGALVREGV
ncbi:benzoate-CoA ligase [Methylosinus sp. sav-2]|uniref:AMP-binding protein n=1 Tax=Methylosinus sp. sav-2 TaxID=2485168 RepID=UPI00068BC2D6|nr:AMP-binding protein [Methylosinus sp. sav-2]TDX61783.1 benzoate-CoA ligase [Methylosinus sp. sav-2]